MSEMKATDVSDLQEAKRLIGGMLRQISGHPQGQPLMKVWRALDRIEREVINV